MLRSHTVSNLSRLKGVAALQLSHRIQEESFEERLEAMMLFAIILTLSLSLNALAGVEALKIGAFNIQIFGTAKMSDPNIADMLVRICQRYDILVIQEVRDSTGTAIVDLLSRVNSPGTANYDMVISDRLGRTTSKEQYAFFYRTDVGLTVTNSYHYDDGDEALGTDTFEREPFIVRFSSSRTSVHDFVLVAIHTAPHHAVAEIQALDAVRESIVTRWRITDIMILGDFNADCNYVRPSHWDSISLWTRYRTYDWLIGHDVDTTVTSTNCAYDRIVVSGPTLKGSVLPHSGRVFDFSRHFHCNCAAEAVSDHYPVEVDLM
ncbi:PREDICTED: deoxyribonuclease-1-like [Branchiostoma belcheri]|uniref:Deoxyribonuclease-1-like n=1 Tax=Branchiostoma belcheri TaxID=7741 RepID=A0A6P4YH10_BRABE|nr:PREDICTED: deoxyribonuclease-1-like [Branchiostoma belcheri]